MELRGTGGTKGPLAPRVIREIWGQRGRRAPKEPRGKEGSSTQKVVFQNAVVNTPGDFSLTTGTFKCRVSGLYYFVFHAASRVSMCLRLRSEVVSETDLGFCDYNSRGTGQVLSGGAVLQLTKDQHVWMEGFTDNQSPSVSTDIQEKQIIFNGFLLFPIS
ncbi:unnamed protein product [Merluccius merluccius]